MIAAAFSFWQMPRRAERTAPDPSKPRPAPVFIGDAVQPWGGETMLLAILRAQAEDETSRNG